MSYDVDVDLSEINVQISLYADVEREKIDAALSKYKLECPGLGYYDQPIEVNGMMIENPPSFEFSITGPEIGELQTDKDFDDLRVRLFDVSYRLLKDLGVEVFPRDDVTDEEWEESCKYGIRLQKTYTGYETWDERGHL